MQTESVGYKLTLLAQEDAGRLVPDSPPHSGAPLPVLPGDDQAARFAFLAAAGELLSSSLDDEQTLRHLARLAVPILGDLCIVDVIEGDELRRVATTHLSAVKTGLLDELRDDYPATIDSPQPAGRVVRSGQPELLAEVTPEVIASRTRDGRHAELIQSLGIRSHMAVPLVARGATVGVISLGITESERRYGDGDLALVQDLARLAALAVDNARLYRRAQDDVAERRRAEDALRLSERRFRAVMEQSPLSTQIFNASGVPIRVNRAWEELWGLTLAEIPEYNILHDPQLETRGIAPLIRRAFAGEAVELPAIRYDPDETIKDRSHHADPVRWVRAFAYPVKDDSGAVLEVVLVHEDVTEERKAAGQLRASEERLRLALAAGRMNVWDWDLATNRVECSDNAREFWGIDVGQAEDFIAVVSPEDQPRLADAAAAAQSTGGDYAAEYRLRRGNGDTRWVQSRGRVERDASGRAVRIRGVTVDISSLKAAEENTRLLADAGETLGASLDYHDTLRNLAAVLVPRLADWYAVDLITEAGTLEREAAYHPDPARVALASEIFNHYPPRRSDRFGAWHVLATRQPEWAAEITEEVLLAVAHSPEHLGLLRALGLRSYMCVPLVARRTPIGVMTLVQAESGRRYGAADVELVQELARRVAVAVDNARLFQQLRAEDRRKDEFLATLAHELRNPLAPIRTGLALLRAAPDAATSERTRQVIDRQLAHMVRLIDDLLDLSRVTRGKVQLDLQRVDLAAIIESALESSRPLVEAAGLRLTVRLPDAPVTLLADRTRLGTGGEQPAQQRGEVHRGGRRRGPCRQPRRVGADAHRHRYGYRDTGGDAEGDLRHVRAGRPLRGTQPGWTRYRADARAAAGRTARGTGVGGERGARPGQHVRRAAAARPRRPRTGRAACGAGAGTRGIGRVAPGARGRRQYRCGRHARRAAAALRPRGPDRGGGAGSAGPPSRISTGYRLPRYRPARHERPGAGPPAARAAAPGRHDSGRGDRVGPAGGP